MTPSSCWFNALPEHNDKDHQEGKADARNHRSNNPD